MVYLNPLKNCVFCSNCNIYDFTKVIKKCTYFNDLLSTEALLNKKLQPNLNNQLGPNKGSRVSINIFKHSIFVLIGFLF